MSPVASSVSDGGKTKKKSSPSKLKEESEVEDSEAQQSGADDGEDDEEEYEIEAILDAGRGRFPKVHLALSPPVPETRRKLAYLCPPEQARVFGQVEGLWPRPEQLGDGG
jgi:hypothetical protein